MLEKKSLNRELKQIIIFRKLQPENVCRLHLMNNESIITLDNSKFSVDCLIRSALFKQAQL